MVGVIVTVGGGGEVYEAAVIGNIIVIKLLCVTNSNL